MTGIQNRNISKHALTRHPAQLHHRHENDVEGQQHGDDRIWLASRNSRLWQHRTDVSSTTSVSELDQTNPTLHTASAKPHSPPASKSQIHWFYPFLRGIWCKAQKKTILLWLGFASSCAVCIALLSHLPSHQSHDLLPVFGHIGFVEKYFVGRTEARKTDIRHKRLNPVILADF